jgi:glycerol-3-phosphate dehydrogenase
MAFRLGHLAAVERQRLFMKRDLSALDSQDFDVLVIGGGILGACAAWDAALRGLTVALIERSDFASGASANSLKVVHGGLRYLQHLDLARMRESITERSTWLRIAPHLIEPLPVLVPTYRRGLQHRALLGVASAVNDLVASDRNRNLVADRLLPRGRALSRRETIDLVPEMEAPDLTGGVLFYDGQMYNSERLVLEVVQAASAAGAAVGNYVEFDGPLLTGGRVVGAKVRDALSGDRFDVRASVIVNAGGAGAAGIAEQFTRRPDAVPVGHCMAVNVMLPAQGHRVAFAIKGKAPLRASLMSAGARQFFAVPWRDRLIVGTGYYQVGGNPQDYRLSSDQVRDYLEVVNSSWPGSDFDHKHIVMVHAGIVPTLLDPSHQAIRLLKRHQIVDHSVDSVPNVFTAVTGKYTTARRAAEDAINKVAQRLGKGLPSCETASTPLPGCTSDSVHNLALEARRRHRDLLAADVLDHMVRTYGRSYDVILGYRDTVADWDLRVTDSAPVIKAQWIHGIREELAQTPDDLVWRRTELGARGMASEDAGRLASKTLTAELGSRY